jgi:hypothetical protein
VRVAFGFLPRMRPAEHVHRDGHHDLRKFGTVRVLVSMAQTSGRRVRVQATVDGTPEFHEYNSLRIEGRDQRGRRRVAR